LNNDAVTPCIFGGTERFVGGIHHRFEVVEVIHQEGDWALGPHGPFDVIVSRLKHRPPIE